MSDISERRATAAPGARLGRLWAQIPLTWREIAGLRGDFWLAMAMTLLSAATGLLLPGRARYLVEDVIPGGQLSLVAREIGILLLIVSLAIAFSSVRRYLLERLAVRMVARIRSRFFARILNAAPRALQKAEGGNIFSGFTHDITRYYEVMQTIYAVLIPSAAFIVAYVGGMIWFSWELSLTLMLVIVPLILVTGYFAQRIHDSTHIVHGNLAALNRELGDVLNGIREIKLFTLEDRVQAQFDQVNRDTEQSFIAREKLTTLHPFAVSMCVAVGLGAILLISAWAISAGMITVGALTGFMVCVALAYPPIQEFSHSLSGVMQLSAVRERVDRLMTLPSEDTHAGAVGAKPVGAAISLRSVSFGYEPGNTVLDGIDLEIAEGEQVAIVGPSGAGKSTLLELLPRFHRPRSGQVLIGGCDTAAMSLATLRGSIGLVLQIPFLFRATLMENLRAGAPRASRKEVLRVARAARVDVFAEQLPKGYDTMIEPGGGNLSVGQRQRIAIARALLKDPPILLLDEPTSALDAASEAHVSAAVREAARQRTTLIVAHRLSTVKDVDRVVALDHGRVVEQGGHDELLARGGLYAEMWHQAQLTRQAEG